MADTLAAQLHAAVALVAPIVGVSVGGVMDKTTWRVDFSPEATDAQKQAAQSVLTAFDPSSPPVESVIAERERRLALGFNYNFNDARGVHRIGTAPSDMQGWDEVSKAASALIATSTPSATLNIVTNTGPVTLTAMEWQSVVLSAASFRQPIWQASFSLEAASPIPADYASDARWPPVQ